MKILLMALLTSAILLSGHRAGAVAFQLEGKYWCMNYSGQLKIIAKIAPKQYEVQFIDFLTKQGRSHMVLFTTKSEFDSGGMVMQDLWVKTTNGHDEMIKVKLSDGFEKSVDVIRESVECETKSKEKPKNPQAEKEKAAQEYATQQAKQDAIVEKFNNTPDDVRLANCKKNGAPNPQACAYDQVDIRNSSDYKRSESKK